RGARIAHPVRGRSGEHPGFGSAQDQGRTTHRVPHRPQIDPKQKVAAELDHFWLACGHPWSDHRRMPRRRVAAIVEPLYAVLCDMRPLLVGERSEIRAFLADVAFYLGDVADRRIPCGTPALEVRQGMPRYEGSDIV